MQIAADGGGSYWSGRDHLAGGYSGRGVYHWSGYGGCVWRLRRGRGEREAGRLREPSRFYGFYLECWCWLLALIGFFKVSVDSKF